MNPTRPHLHLASAAPTRRFRLARSSDVNASAAASSTNTPKQHDGWVYVPHATVISRGSRALSSVHGLRVRDPLSTPFRQPAGPSAKLRARPTSRCDLLHGKPVQASTVPEPAVRSRIPPRVSRCRWVTVSRWQAWLVAKDWPKSSVVNKHCALQTAAQHCRREAVRTPTTGRASREPQLGKSVERRIVKREACGKAKSLPLATARHRWARVTTGAQLARRLSYCAFSVTHTSSRSRHSISPGQSLPRPHPMEPERGPRSEAAVTLAGRLGPPAISLVTRETHWAPLEPRHGIRADVPAYALCPARLEQQKMRALTRPYGRALEVPQISKPHVLRSKRVCEERSLL
jgi:hypothetical protein